MSQPKFQEKSRLGRVLVNRGYISETQLEQALKQQRSDGGRLGEILVAMDCVSEREIDKALRHQARYRRAAAVVAAVTVPFQPAISVASVNTSGQNDAATAGEMQQHGFQPMSDDDMAAVTGQGNNRFFDRFETVSNMAGAARDREDPEAFGDSVDGLKMVTSSVVPVINMLDYELTVSGVHYREGENQFAIREDGALQLALPAQIEEVRMDNIRVGNGASMGSISLHDIRFSPDSIMTIKAR